MTNITITFLTLTAGYDAVIIWREHGSVQLHPRSGRRLHGRRQRPSVEHLCLLRSRPHLRLQLCFHSGWLWNTGWALWILEYPHGLSSWVKSRFYAVWAGKLVGTSGVFCGLLIFLLILCCCILFLLLSGKISTKIFFTIAGLAGLFVCFFGHRFFKCGE